MKHWNLPWTQRAHLDGHNLSIHGPGDEADGIQTALHIFKGPGAGVFAVSGCSGDVRVDRQRAAARVIQALTDQLKGTDQFRCNARAFHIARRFIGPKRHLYAIGQRPKLQIRIDRVRPRDQPKKCSSAKSIIRVVCAPRTSRTELTDLWRD